MIDTRVQNQSLEADTECRDALIRLLEELQYADVEGLLQRLDKYAELLFQHNAIVNMVSRKMTQQMYYTHHFLDSLMILNCMTPVGASVLDFGTGGGLPLLPLKLAYPTIKAVYLDSTHRKIDALHLILEGLGLRSQHAVCCRLEDYALPANANRFDYVVCRAVAMEERYRKPLHQILKPGAKVMFYKAQKIDDLAGYKYRLEYETQHPILGYRRILSIEKKDLR